MRTLLKKVNKIMALAYQKGISAQNYYYLHKSSIFIIIIKFIQVCITAPLHLAQ